MSRRRRKNRDLVGGAATLPIPTATLDQSPPPVQAKPVEAARVTSPQAPSDKAGTRLIAATFHGPLPPPALLREYEQINPGLSKNLVDLMITEAQHRRQMETSVFNEQKAEREAQRSQRARGQIFGLTISLCAILGSLSLMAFRPCAAAATVTSVICGATLIALVVAFVLGRVYSPGSRRNSSPKDHQEQ